MTEQDARPTSVFLVDDNALLAASLERWLGRSDQFRWAGWLPGPEGIEDALATVVPDVLLVDWDIPRVDTPALLARLTAAFPNICIAVLSAHLRPDYIQAALDAGAQGYISKAQNPADLAAEVRLLGEGKVVLSKEVRWALAGRDGDGG